MPAASTDKVGKVRIILDGNKCLKLIGHDWEWAISTQLLDTWDELTETSSSHESTDFSLELQTLTLRRLCIT
jgi:hypothetical protein